MSLAPLLTASPIIQFHAYAAIVALLIGGAIFYGPTGNSQYRVLGRVWVGLMALVAISSFFIWTMRLFGSFSPIYLLLL